MQYEGIAAYHQHFLLSVHYSFLLFSRLTPAFFGLAEPVLHRDSQTICTYPILMVVSPDLLLSALCLLLHRLHSITLANVYTHTHTHTFGCCMQPGRFQPETYCSERLFNWQHHTLDTCNSTIQRVDSVTC